MLNELYKLYKHENYTDQKSLFIFITFNLFMLLLLYRPEKAVGTFRASPWFEQCFFLLSKTVMENLRSAELFFFSDLTTRFFVFVYHLKNFMPFHVWLFFAK